jgi:FxLD family lantipeptide
MAPLLTMDSPVHGDAVIDDAEFEFDLRVVESTSRIALLSCDTSDGCGSTCSTSACTSFSNDPF